MTDIYEFEGKTLCNTNSVLGEGPTYDPGTNTVWWFNILGKELHELNLSTDEKKVHSLPMMASVLARIDAGRQLLATEEGLFVRDVASGNLTFYAALENDRPENRSNDGRTHPSGALWIGTMSKRAENQAGAIYHVAAGKVTKLFSGISIPNSICFSPDGTIGYFTDTRLSRLMRVMVDPQTGLPPASRSSWSTAWMSRAAWTDRSAMPTAISGTPAGALASSIATARMACASPATRYRPHSPHAQPSSAPMPTGWR